MCMRINMCVWTNVLGIHVIYEMLVTETLATAVFDDIRLPES